MIGGVAHPRRRDAVRTSRLLPLLLALPSMLSAQQVLRATRDLTIGANANDLSAVGAMAVSASGIIAVLQPQDLTIRFFDAGGKALGRFGRDGEGPGEFRSVGWAGWNGDTLSVEDSGIRRVTFIGPDVRLLRVVPDPIRILPPRSHPKDPPVVGDAAIVAVMADRSVLLDFFPGSRSLRPSWLHTTSSSLALSLVHVDSAGRFLRIAADMEDHGPRCVWGAAAVSIPFCSHWVIGDGFAHGIASVAAVVGDAPQYRLILIGSLHGDTLINRTYSYLPQPISGRVADSVREKLLATPRISPERRAAYQSLPFPKYFPPVRRILVGMDRSVWLEEPGAPDGSHRWRLLDASGTVRGVVTIPSNVRLRDVRHDMAWGTAADEDGLESIVRFRIH